MRSQHFTRFCTHNPLLLPVIPYVYLFICFFFRSMTSLDYSEVKRGQTGLPTNAHDESEVNLDCFNTFDTNIHSTRQDGWPTAYDGDALIGSTSDTYIHSTPEDGWQTDCDGDALIRRTFVTYKHSTPEDGWRTDYDGDALISSTFDTYIHSTPEDGKTSNQDCKWTMKRSKLTQSILDSKGEFGPLNTDGSIWMNIRPANLSFKAEKVCSD